MFKINYIKFLIINLCFFLNIFILSIGKFPPSDFVSMLLIYVFYLIIEFFIYWKLKKKFILHIFFIFNYYNFIYYLIDYGNFINIINTIVYFLIVFITLQYKSVKYIVVYNLFFITLSVSQLIFFKKNVNSKNIINNNIAKKNIYIICIDGLISKNVYEKYFKTEYPASEKLKELNFAVTDFESPGSTTLESYSSLIKYENKQNISPRKWREIISNKKSSFYLDLEKMNYKKQFIYKDNYFGTDQNNVFNIFYPKNIDYYSFYSYVDKRWGFPFFYLFEKKQVRNVDQINNIINHFTSINTEKNKWLSIGHIWYPGHTKINYNSNNLKELNEYKNYYAKSQNELVSYFDLITNEILKKDKNSIIMFWGDHGSYLLRNLNINKQIEKNGLFTKKDLKLDSNSVLLAIYPKEIGLKVISKTKINYLLFRNIIEIGND